VSRFHSICIALVAVIAITSLTAIHLDSQGVYYDELHQAPAAFRYVGSHPKQFMCAYRGIPLLNMTYSGAIKSAVYGAYLKFVNPHFSVVTWRLVGIAFVAAGVFCFYIIAGTSLRIESAVLFGCLLLSDISVIVMTRHDWGPTALALALRLTFLAVWMSIALRKAEDYKFALAGLIVGISIFEKLSSVVMLAPLFILLLTVPARRKSNWIAAALGLMAGSFPLVIANVATYRLGQGFISLSGTTPGRRPLGLTSLIEYAHNYLSLGQGQFVRNLVFGDFPNAFVAKSETGLMCLVLVIIFIAAIRLRRSGDLMRLAAAAAAAYVVLAVAILLLPRATFIHHWVIGTPFQYAAIALGLAALGRRTWSYKFLLAVTLCLIAIRIPAIMVVESSFISGKASVRFDPGFNRLVQLAATKSKDAVFISSDWGSGNQIYCGTDGNDDSFAEPFWDARPAKVVLEVASKTKKRTLYLITTGLAPQFSEASASIIDAMTNSQDWQSKPAEEEFSNLGPIEVRKFVRRIE
jgi:hypothetical protein